MVRFEDECVGCPPELGCDGDQCPYKNVPRSYGDECGGGRSTLLVRLEAALP